jgi:hypothetical protein
LGVRTEQNLIFCREGPHIATYRNLDGYAESNKLVQRLLCASKYKIQVDITILNKWRQLYLTGSRFGPLVGVFQIRNAARFPGSAGIISTNRMTISFSLQTLLHVVSTILVVTSLEES